MALEEGSPGRRFPSGRKASVAGQYWAQVRQYNRASGIGKYTIKVRRA
jgi:hypothetical protein